MWSVLLCATFFVLGLGVEGGTAIQNCSMPTESILVYFDLKQISLTMLQLHDSTDVINSPITCHNKNDKACDDQACCANEVGCCPTDSTNHVRNCGCQVKGSSNCNYPAPLAVLGKTACNVYGKKNGVACLRELRWEEDYILGKNSFLPPVLGAQPNVQVIQESRVKKKCLRVVFNEVVDTVNSAVPQKNIFLHEFTVEQLAHNLNKTMIENLIQYVDERKIKGLPFGLPE